MEGPHEDQVTCTQGSHSQQRAGLARADLCWAEGQEDGSTDPWTALGKK